MPNKPGAHQPTRTEDNPDRPLRQSSNSRAPKLLYQPGGKGAGKRGASEKRRRRQQPGEGSPWCDPNVSAPEPGLTGLATAAASEHGADAGPADIASATGTESSTASGPEQPSTASGAEQPGRPEPANAAREPDAVASGVEPNDLYDGGKHWWSLPVALGKRFG